MPAGSRERLHRLSREVFERSWCGDAAGVSRNNWHSQVTAPHQQTNPPQIAEPVLEIALQNRDHPRSAAKPKRVSPDSIHQRSVFFLTVIFTSRPACSVSGLVNSLALENQNKSGVDRAPHIPLPQPKIMWSQFSPIHLRLDEID